MGDSLDFEDEEDKQFWSSWERRQKTTTSFDAEGSRFTFENQNLQIVYKKEAPSVTNIIPATLYETLSYYRAFVSSPSKIDMVTMHQMHVNRFLWYYVFNVFCKSLPSTYVYVFLSLYAPEDPFFIPKMVPIFYGCLWSSIFSAFFVIIQYTKYVIILWDIIIFGLLYKSPWNRCDSKIVTLRKLYNITCYELGDFVQKIQNKTPSFKGLGYKLQSNPKEEFQMAPALYFLNRPFYEIESIYLLSLCRAIVIVSVAMLHKQLFKKYIWKALHYSQWALNIIMLATFIHLVFHYFEFGFKKIDVLFSVDSIFKWDPDIDLLAESMASPPIVHILTARGTQKVKPSRHSSLIIASNAAYYIFRGLLAYMIKLYCESLVGAQILITDLSKDSSIFWLIYFSYFYLGEFYTIFFFLSNAIMEFFVLVITFHCLAEAIATERQWVNRWYVVILLVGTLIAYSFIPDYILPAMCYVFCTSVANYAEIIALYCFYPLGRLVDDFTFHFGAPPTSLRIWNLRIVPVFYTVKFFTLLKGIFDLITATNILHYYNVLYLQIIPFILSAAYVIYKVVYKRKEGWTQLFVPDPEWGPKDFSTRQLRKQYDSRQYIDSQASRELCRYFMEKSELETYKVDVQYDNYINNSASQSGVRLEKNRKSV